MGGIYSEVPPPTKDQKKRRKGKVYLFRGKKKPTRKRFGMSALGGGFRCVAAGKRLLSEKKTPDNPAKENTTKPSKTKKKAQTEDIVVLRRFLGFKIAKRTS